VSWHFVAEDGEGDWVAGFREGSGAMEEIVRGRGGVRKTEWKRLGVVVVVVDRPGDGGLGGGGS
jgi:hypothetical protein